ncbi:hypothetical protein BJ508DRAFT_68455 [Ascobolus immersus RN42]|uniref:Uncharacterized protein n=1 Tax=Ascobolus immersus RN42 TaxID=1160509 RepID=A0A3N4HLI5_ASCIM|nr:hypothetical protein BJ508DRAFT_68455 [Ascobolus immersus RN42]
MITGLNITYGLQNNKKAIERSENATGHAIKYPYLLAKPDLEHNYCGTVLTSADLNDIAAGVAKAALDLREAEQCIHSLDSFFRHMSKEDALFQHPTDKLQVAQQSTSYAKMAKAQADAQLNYMDWWDSRAKNQQTVLFNLMTHYDSKASLELAEIMRKDSASMKTVAVMTMTFLPATFLAAVFALPSLKWPENKPNSVIQDGFGLYWGISVATTAAVFATWYFATRRIVGQSADQSAKAESRLSGLIAKVKLGLSGPKKDSDSDPGPGSGSDPKPDSRRRDIPLQKLREIKDNMRQTVEGLRNGHTGQFLDVENLKNKVKQKMHSRKTDSVQQSHSTVAEQIVPESSTSVENPGVPTGNNPPGLGIRRRNTSGSEPQSLNGVKGRSGQVGHIEDKSGGSAEASSKIVSLREVVVNAEL